MTVSELLATYEDVRNETRVMIYDSVDDYNNYEGGTDYEAEQLFSCDAKVARFYIASYGLIVIALA